MAHGFIVTVPTIIDLIAARRPNPTSPPVMVTTMLHLSGVEAIQWVLHRSKDNPAFHGCERRGV
jgi:hypothetical protein